METYNELKKVLERVNAYGHYLNRDQLSIEKACIQNLKFLLTLELEV